MIRVDWETFLAFSLKYKDLANKAPYVTEKGKEEVQRLLEVFVQNYKK